MYTTYSKEDTRKKTTYAKWPKSMWYVQATFDDDYKAIGAYVLLMGQESYHILPWDTFNYDNLVSKFQALPEEITTLCGLLEELEKDHRPATVKPTINPADLDLPML